MPLLLGRTHEIRCLDGLLAAARESSGGVLVLRGEAGIGKTALLDHVRGAAGFRLVEASGSEFETDLPFAGLHQLCVPVLGHLDELEPQRRRALEVAFGMAEGAPDLFRIGLAALDLLAAAARELPLLCVVDDAHWLDTASAKALSFLARRIAAEPVAMVFAAREGLTELPSLELTGLSDADARKLLGGVPDDRVLTEARGNPLALQELPKSGFGLPDSSSVVQRVERGFQSRLNGLPGRRLLILASADATGDPGLLWAAAEVLGLTTDADTGDLVTISTKVRFCHPLARSAVYRAATAAERRAAHRALAEVTADPDRGAWHRAEATTGPDEEVAAELEAAAGRARTRGGLRASAAFLARAAALSLDPVARTERALQAAQAELDAGAATAAAELLSSVEPQDDLQHARADLLRGRIAFVRQDDGPALMLSAAHRLAAIDPRWSRECFLDALEMGLVVGRAAGVMDTVLAEARSAPPSEQPDVLDALVLLTGSGHQSAAPLLRRVLTERALWTRRPALATMIAGELWDLDTHVEITRWLRTTGRDTGSPWVLRLGLAQEAVAATHRGELAAVATLVAEEEAIADAFGDLPMTYARVHLLAWRGELRPLDAALTEVGARGKGQLIANIHWAKSVLYNARGDYPAALAEARAAVEAGDLYLAGIALPEQVEAAVRCGVDASAALAELSARSSASGTAWARGVTACARALVSGVEDDYLEAVGTGSPAPYRARAHLLYGEWLRRAGRRNDAREHLRTAHESFADMGVLGFAQRAADELKATGEVARSRSADAFEALTAQEAHIARLVATGATSKEVAARLFLSPRTVDAHLRNVYRKLGIHSRRQLRTPSADFARRT